MDGRSPLRERRDGRILALVLSRPEKLNALDRPLLEALLAALSRADRDPAIGAVVLTGEGRAFSAGADLAAILAEDHDAFLDLLAETFRRLHAFPKPLVAALNGLTLAGGLELALACDAILAAESVRVGDGHVASGLLPGGGSLSLLPGRIGAQRARALLLGGQIHPAREMRDWGLVDEVVADAELAAAAGRTAERLAAHPPATFAALKSRLAAGRAEALAEEARAMRAHLDHPEAQAGLARFAGRRSAPA